MFRENFITLSSLLEKKCLKLSSKFLLWQTGKRETNETQISRKEIKMIKVEISEIEAKSIRENQ